MVKDGVTLQRAASLYGVSSVWLYAGGVAGERLVPAWIGTPAMELAP